MKEIICRDIYAKEYKTNASSLIFRPSVYGILIEKNKILLVRQFKDGFDFPGGGVEIDETVEEALKREFWEETGLQVEPVKIIDIKNSFFKFRYKEIFSNSILMYYLCRKISGELSMANFDEYEKEYADMPEWIDIDKIGSIKFYNAIDSPSLIKKAFDLSKEK